MSKYCGKCDLYDWVDNNKELLKNTTITLGDIPITIEDERDLILYAPNIVCFSNYTNNKRFVKITTSDYNRIRELDLIEFYVREIKKEKNIIRRSKLEFNDEKIYKKRFAWMGNENKKPVLEIINRMEHKNKVDLSDIRLTSLDLYRKFWYEDMVLLGYSKEFAYEWVWKMPYNEEHLNDLFG